jgi:MFS family permease
VSDVDRRSGLAGGRNLRYLLIFVAVTLVVDTSTYAAITPLLPRLSDEYGLSKSEAGFLAAAYPAGTLLLSLPAAWMVTVVGPRRALMIGLATLAVSSAGFALAGSAAGLTVARFIQGGAAAAMWAGSLAWLVAAAPRERRAEVIGAAVGAAIAGALFGPVIGAAADVVGITAVFGAFVVVPLAQMVWASRLPGAPAPTGMTLGSMASAVTDRTMRRGMWLMGLPGIAFGVINVLVPLRLDALGAGAAVIAAAFLGAIAFEAVMAPVAGRMADRRGRIWPARIGLASGGVAVALLPLPRVVPLVVLLVMIVAPLLGMLWSPAMALLSDGAEALGLDPALGFGLANMAWGLGATFGASGGGALADAAGDAVPYLLLSAAAVGTAAYFSAAGQAMR